MLHRCDFKIRKQKSTKMPDYTYSKARHICMFEVRAHFSDSLNKRGNNKSVKLTGITSLLGEKSGNVPGIEILFF